MQQQQQRVSNYLPGPGDPRVNRGGRSTYYRDSEAVTDGVGVQQKYLQQLSTKQSIESHDFNHVRDNRRSGQPGLPDINDALRNKTTFELQEFELLWTLKRDVEKMGEDKRSSSGRLFTTLNGLPGTDEQLCQNLKLAGVNLARLDPIHKESSTIGLQATCQFSGNSSVLHTGTTAIFPFQFYSAIVDRVPGRVSTTKFNRKAGRQLARLEVDRVPLQESNQPSHRHPVGMCLENSRPGGDCPTYISPGQFGTLQVFTNP
jgi:hypothetical protein